MPEKLRLQWRGPPPAEADALARTVFALVAARQPGRPGPSQDETLTLEAVGPGVLAFEYVFDHDYASQYDATERWSGTAALIAGAWTRTDWRTGG